MEGCAYVEGIAIWWFDAQRQGSEMVVKAPCCSALVGGVVRDGV